MIDAREHTAQAWQPAQKLYRWAFFGEPGTLATATSLADNGHTMG
jgi:phage tail sheath gpL-like